MKPAIDRKSSDQSGRYRIARKFAREMFGNIQPSDARCAQGVKAHNCSCVVIYCDIHAGHRSSSILPGLVLEIIIERGDAATKTAAVVRSAEDSWRAEFSHERPVDTKPASASAFYLASVDAI